MCMLHGRNCLGGSLMMVTQSFNESGISIDLVDIDVDDPAISYPVIQLDNRY